MTDNEIISEWRGECRHTHFSTVDEQDGWVGTRWCLRCKAPFYSENLEEILEEIVTQYDYDPSSWDEALFDEIEKTGLWRKFIQNHGEITCNKETMEKYAFKEVDMMEFLDRGGFLMVRSTPAQKARALAQAITDGRKDERD